MPKFGAFTRDYILSTLGHTEAAKCFADEILRQLVFDKLGQGVTGYARPDPLQREILENLARSCDAFLATLKPLCKAGTEDVDKIKETDTPTANLLLESLWHLDREAWLQSEMQLHESSRDGSETDKLIKSLCELSAVFEPGNENDFVRSASRRDIVEFNYPFTLLQEVKKFQAVVAYAQTKISKGRGNSSGRVSTQKRKLRLTDAFIYAYWRNFERYPKKTDSTTNLEYGIFIDYLHAAGLASASEKYSFLKAINRHRDKYEKYNLLSRQLLAPRDVFQKN